MNENACDGFIHDTSALSRGLAKSLFVTMNTIPEYTERIVQRAQGGMTRRAAEKVAHDCGHLEELGDGTVDAIVERWHWVARMHHRVVVGNVMRAAEARGVHVVEDLTLPHEFVMVELPDEGPPDG
jgi:hypothetical protein